MTAVLNQWNHSAGPLREASLSPSESPGAVINMEVFGQLLEMDDEGDDSFSKSLIETFLEQAEVKLSEMDQALANNAPEEISSRGHFLKGSSAALGLTKVHDTCEKIQNVGSLKRENGEGSLGREEAMRRCAVLLDQLKMEVGEAREALLALYGTNGNL